MINHFHSKIKKQQHIQTLFKRKEYAVLFAFYRHELPLFKEGIIICHLKLFRLFLTEPKWKSSIFFILGLLATGQQKTAKQELSRLKHKESNSFILSQLAFYIPHFAKYLCEEIGHTQSLFFASLCAHLGDLQKLDYTLSHTNKREYHKNPQGYLLKNFLLLNNKEEKIANLNYFLAHYNLEPISLLDNKDIFIGNLIVPQKIPYLGTTQDLPLVSILVTIYNTQEYIENTLTSLLSQSYPNIEIIVIDDNSTDDSLLIIKRFIKRHSNIKLVSLEHNVGTYIAKNIGIKYAQGEFIICHDSDDWAHPRKIELQVKPLLDNPNLVATFSKWVRLDKYGQPYTHYIYPLLRLNPSSALFRRKEVESRMGLWDWVRIGADSEFNTRLQLVFGAQRYCIINKPLTFGAHRENSLMTHTKTGYIDGFSSQRELYGLAWNYWHITQLKQGKSIKLPKFPKREFYKKPIQHSENILSIIEKHSHLDTLYEIN
ncbi:hypothetical protein A1D29_00320 [Pasteurellaceae bacterium Orientalotternb1]|nr:hypothetical protein A1D29_00320 [Pasteurellaceae bacterium Orientalotternb1]